MTENVRKKIVAEILSQSKQGADSEADLLRKELSSETAPETDFIYRHLKNFILFKYILPEDTAEDDLALLTEMSLQRSLKLDKKIVAELDTAMPCSSATSAQAKKILLLYAVQKEIFPESDPEKLVLLKTVREMADYIASSINPEK